MAEETVVAEQSASDLDANKKETTNGPTEATTNGEEENNNVNDNNNSVIQNSTGEDRSEDYHKLIAYGLSERVSAQLEEIYKTGKLVHIDLDERALDALKEFPIEGALNVLAQFVESNLEHVSNKSAYLCGVMKTYRQKSKLLQAQIGGGGTPINSTGNGAPNGAASLTAVQVKGPDEDKIKIILNRTGYTLDVTTGQRKYGGPPPNWEGNPPPSGCEVFVGKIPKDMYEDELIPLFEKCGRIWDLRLMMDPMSGQNRGYAFVTFCDRQGANEAVKQLNDYEIQKGKKIGVTISLNNHRLFVGNIPKNKGRDDLVDEFNGHAPGLVEVIIYNSPDDKKKNRGFCFLEYESHKAASLAKRRLGTGRVKVWGCDIIVDWADPQEEPDNDIMSKVKVLYVRNLTNEVTEEKLKEVFDPFGKVERVKKIKDYAFVHFDERENAVSALNDCNGKDLGGSSIEVSLAKPPSDKKKKEDQLRARERRMMNIMAQSFDFRGQLPPRGRNTRGSASRDYGAWSWWPSPAWNGNPRAANGGGGGGGGGARWNQPHMGGGSWTGGFNPQPYGAASYWGGGGGGGRQGGGGLRVNAGGGGGYQQSNRPWGGGGRSWSGKLNR